MLIIRTNCPYCGEVDLKPEEIKLWVVRDDREGEYYFFCPSHEREVRKPADWKIVALLAEAGVEIHELGPNVVLEAEASLTPVPSGRALTEDDFIAFGRWLEPLFGPEIAAAAADPYQ